MRVFYNGSNSYGQLNIKKTILTNLEEVLEYEVIKEICLSYCFSVILTSADCWVYINNEIKLIPRIFGEKIIHVTCNDEKIILLSDTGKLIRLNPESISELKEIPSMPTHTCAEEKIINVSSCSKLTVSYSNKGTIFSIPNKLNFHNPHIIDTKCGREHCLLLDKFGNVYSFGRGSRGQLGHGELDDKAEPTLIEALAGIKIRQISAGGWHSAVLSQDGDLYIWGWNGNGQIGLGTNTMEGKEGEVDSVSVMASPHVVDFERNVIIVACGSRHTIVLLDNNHLYGCGWNKYNQLKDLKEENIQKFTHLHDFQQEEVVGIVCGPWNSAVVCK